MSNLSRQVRLSLRRLRRHPGFTVGVLAIVALATGVCAAILAIADATLFRALPYPDPERLVFLHENVKGSGFNAASYPNLQDWRDHSTAFQDIAFFADWRHVTVSGDFEPLRARANFVTSNYFELLGAQPAYGETFDSSSDRFPGAPKLAVVSHGFWQTRLGGRPQAVDSVIHLNGEPFTVVAIMSPAFSDLAEVNHPTDVWLPLATHAELFGIHTLQRRTARWIFGIGRLKPGASMDEARQDLARVAQRLEQEFPDSNKDFGVTVVPLRRYFFGLYNDLLTPVRALMAASLLVLLVALFNVLHLVMLRISQQESELALRLALGAGLKQLFSRSLIELVLLMLAGVAAGLLLAVLCVRLLASISPIEFPGFVDLQPSMRVFSGAALAGLGAALVLALTSVLLYRSKDLSTRLLSGSRGGAPSYRQILQKGLVVSEIALTGVLLIGMGLMGRSLLLLNSSPLGFQPQDVMTLRVELRGSDYSEPSQRANFARELQRRTQAQADVRSAWIWSASMPGYAYRTIDLYDEAQAEAEERELVRGFQHHVWPSALQQMGIPLLRGRYLTPQDRQDSLTVALVSQSMAEDAWPGQSPLGKRFKWRTRSEIDWVTVVGVVGDAKMRGRLDSSNTREVYFPYLQTLPPEVILMAHSQAEAGTLLPRLRQVVRDLDGDLPVFEPVLLSDFIDREQRTLRAAVVLFGLFAALAAVLAAIGVFAILSYWTSLRRREIGIRLALGAHPRELVLWVTAKGVRLSLLGALLGLAGAMAAARWLENMVFGITARDPLSYLVALGFLCLLAGLACWLAARRAHSVEPAATLKV
ncbi:MAG TPA: ADOP family duplicated permease [Acidobacteriota bacterium]|nr:ADOP family duplicated permease [Acidobacteriota bacterium]